MRRYAPAASRGIEPPSPGRQPGRFTRFVRSRVSVSQVPGTPPGWDPLELSCQRPVRDLPVRDMKNTRGWDGRTVLARGGMTGLRGREPSRGGGGACRPHPGAASSSAACMHGPCTQGATLAPPTVGGGAPTKPVPMRLRGEWASYGQAHSAPPGTSPPVQPGRRAAWGSRPGSAGPDGRARGT